MQLSTDLYAGSTTWPDTDSTARLLTRSRDITPVNEEAETVEESEIGGSPITFQKELSPEEQQRVEFLQNLLTQTLAMVEGNPTDEQRTRIREIENELEKITGVKTRSRLSAMASKLPGKNDEEDEDERELDYQTLGMDPEEAIHNNKSLAAKGDNPGMQMLRNNALFTAIGALDLSDISWSEG